MGWRIGVDLGGTKIEAVLMNEDGVVVASRRESTPKNDYIATVQAVVALVENLERDLKERAYVGIGTPGAWLAESCAMQNCNSTWLNGKPLLSDLQAGLGERVRMANDADCLALSEALDGAGAGARIVFGVILGTGVGGGVVVDCRLLGGPNGIAGEWGHTPLPYFRVDSQLEPTLAALEARLTSRPCYCGRENCVETFLSGPGLARTHEELWNETATALELGARQDGTAAKTHELYSVMLARSLGQIINVIDPDVIVLGGGVSNIAGLYEQVPRIWTHYVFSGRVSTRLAQARFGDASGVRGAAWLWPARL
jgi:predicted NBD/HSP70 family sugar kinase